MGSDIDRLSAQIADLERRIAALERAPPQNEGPCPRCGGKLTLSDEQPHPVFGVMGVKVRTFTCNACGKAVTRDYDPAKG